MGIEDKTKPTNASTEAAVFDTNYSSPTFTPAKKVQFNQRNPLDAVYWMLKMSKAAKFVPSSLVGRTLHYENLPDFHGAKTNRPASIY
jgi:hypothetical protein